LLEKSRRLLSSLTASSPSSGLFVTASSGQAEIDAGVAAGADAYVTADLRHHIVSEVVERSAGKPELQPPLALIDVSHWASEWPWLPVVAERLRADLAIGGTTVDVRVSEIVTDPWTQLSPADGSQS